MNKFGLIMLRIAFLAAAMVLSNTAQGQEMIMEIPFYHEHSIARHIDDQSVLVYNYSGKGNHFFKIDVNNPSVVQYKALSDFQLKILDFEIFDSVVYFCGKTNDIIPHALFGYFPIANFPEGDIYIDSVSSLREFKKLDVFSVEGDIHVVMTASGIQSAGAIVDVRTIAPNAWQYDIADATKDLYSFDDVAVTDKYVMFSGRLTQAAPFYSMYSSAFWIFPKPTYSGITLFYNTSGIERIQLNNSPSESVYLSTLYGNNTEAAFDIAYNRWEQVGINGMSYFGSITFLKDSSASVSDIRASSNRNHSHVPVTSLVRTDILESTSFVIAPFTFQNKIARPEIIRSIDRFPSGCKAVGVGRTNANHALRFYLLDYFHNEDCVPVQEKAFSHVNRYDDHVEVDVKKESILHVFYTMEFGKGNISSEIICGNSGNN